MWRRVGGAISCATCLLLACGKSEQGTPSANDSAGASAGGLSTTTGGTGSSATTGGKVAMGGGPASAGSTSASGGQAEAGAPEQGGEPSVGGAASCDGGYRACGCGCCAGQTPSTSCVYPERGDDLSAIIAADVARKNDLQSCSAAGCSVGIDYVCCESPPPSVEQATYTTSRFIGAIDRISIDKMTADCSTLTLRQAVPSDPAPSGFALQTPAGWAIERATRLACTSSVTQPRAIGAIGKVTLRVVGDACVADVHLALFFGDAAKGIDAERFDADALPIDLPVAQCH